MRIPVRDDPESPCRFDLRAENGPHDGPICDVIPDRRTEPAMLVPAGTLVLHRDCCTVDIDLGYSDGA